MNKSIPSLAGLAVFLFLIPALPAQEVGSSPFFTAADTPDADETLVPMVMGYDLDQEEARSHTMPLGKMRGQIQAPPATDVLKETLPDDLSDLDESMWTEGQLTGAAPGPGNAPSGPPAGFADGPSPAAVATAAGATNVLLALTTATNAPARPGRKPRTLAEAKYYEARDDIALGEYKVAIPKLEWVIANEPTLLKAWETLGWAYWRVGRKDDMFRLWKRLETIVPFSPTAHNLLAKVYVNQGQMQLAEQHLRKSLELDPTQYEARFTLARVILWQGRAGEAIPMFRELVREKPERMDVQVQLARALDADRQYEESLDIWAMARASEPTNITYLIHEAFARLRVGDLPAAREMGEEIVRQNEQQTEGWVILADVAEYGDPPADAAKELRRIADKTENKTLKLGFIDRLAQLQLRLFQDNPADYPVNDVIKTVQRAIDLAPQNVNFRLFQGELYLMNGNYRDAEDRFKEVLDKFNPHNRRAHQGLFQTYLAWHKYEAAEKYLREMESFDPDDPFRYYFRALFELGRGRYEDAHEALNNLEREGARGAVFTLLYHGLTTSEFMAAPTARSFREHMLALKKAGYKFVTPEQIPAFFDGLKDAPKPKSQSWWQSGLRSVHTAWTGEENDLATLEDHSPERVVCVTFDDGLRSSFRWATPVAEELDIAFSMHIPIGNILHYDPTICSWDELRKYRDTGRWSFGSHLIDASTLAPVDKEGDLVRPLPNRIWLPARDRQETLLEYLLRVQREIKGSWEMLARELGLTYANAYMAYPMGDIGQEDFCNVDKAIPSILLEADLVYDIAFRQSQFGFSVKGDNPLLYQRHEMERGEDGQDVLRFAFENHPVQLARRMRAELAALQGKPYLALRMIELMRRDGAPDSVIAGVMEYVDTHLANKIQQPKQTTRVESEKTPWRLQLKELFLGVGYDYLKDNAYTEETLWSIRGGLNVTPQMTLEAFGAAGDYQYAYSSFETVERTRLETNTSVTVTETTQTGTTQTVTTRTRTIEEKKYYTTMVYRTEFKTEETRIGLRGNYKNSEGSVLSGMAFQRAFKSSSPSNQVDGESMVGGGVEYFWKPTLVTEASSRLEYNCIPTLPGLVKYYLFGMQGSWDIGDSWELAGIGSYQKNSDHNGIFNVKADSWWLMSERQGIYLGLRAQFVNAEEKNIYYWTPHWLQRGFIMGRIRRSYLQTYFEADFRYGLSREKGWPDEVDRYNQNSAQGELYGYYPGENPDKDWEGVVGATLSLRRRFFKHWELQILGSLNDLPDYSERAIRTSLNLNF